MKAATGGVCEELVSLFQLLSTAKMALFEDLKKPAAVAGFAPQPHTGLE